MLAPVRVSVWVSDMVSRFLDTELLKIPWPQSGTWATHLTNDVAYLHDLFHDNSDVEFF